MQDMLHGFQTDLGGISNEIKNLQDSSNSMNIKLRNRKAAQGRFKYFLDRVAVADELVYGICEEQVSENYVDFLQDLSSKLAYARCESTGEAKAQTARAPPVALVAAIEAEAKAAVVAAAGESKGGAGGADGEEGGAGAGGGAAAESSAADDFAPTVAPAATE